MHLVPISKESCNWFPVVYDVLIIFIIRDPQNYTVQTEIQVEIQAANKP